MYGWQKLFRTVLGWNPEMEFLPAIPAAIVLYASIFVIGQLLYHLTKLIVPHPIKEYVLDFVKTMTFCSYPFGHGIMRKNYGEPGYLLAMLPLITITVLSFRDGDGNPVGVWLKYFRKVIPLWKSILKTVLQITAGFAAYHLGMYILRLELHPIYIARLQNYYRSFCTTDMNVPVYMGFGLEFIAVVYETWFSSHVFLSNTVLDTMIKVLNAGILVTMGVHLTGMYMHPAMATGHTWGCGDTNRYAHILIYWVGPMMGAWLSVQIHKRFNLNSTKKTSKQKAFLEKGTSNGKAQATNKQQENENLRKRNGERRKFYN